MSYQNNHYFCSVYPCYKIIWRRDFIRAFITFSQIRAIYQLTPISHAVSRKKKVWFFFCNIFFLKSFNVIGHMSERCSILTHINHLYLFIIYLLANSKSCLSTNFMSFFATFKTTSIHALGKLNITTDSRKPIIIQG